MGPARFWQLWMLCSVAASGYFGARWLGNPHPAEVIATSAQATGGQARGAAEPPARAATPQNASWLVTRLESAETGSELCELLGRLEPSEEVANTYAVTRVLERTQLRSVRACAANALGAQKTPVAQSWLVDLAEDLQPEVSRATLEALATRSDALAHAAVTDAAHSSEPTVRVNAVIALLKARDPETFPLAKALTESLDDSATLGELLDALADSHDVRALPVLEGLIARGSGELHVRAIAALGALGEARAIAVLEPFLAVGSVEEFRAALQALSRLEPERALTQARRILQDGNQPRRMIALDALSHLELPGASDLMASLLDSEEPMLLTFALQSLANTHDPELEPRFIRLLHEGEATIRLSAAHALATLGTPGALAELRSLSKGDSGALAWAARSALEGVPGASDELQALRLEQLANPNSDEAARESAVSILASDPSDAAQRAVVAYLSSEGRSSETLQRVLIDAPPATVARLVQQFQGSADLEQQRALVAALAARSDPRFADALRAAANSDDEALRQTALRGLVSLGDPSASDWIRTQLDTPGAEDRGQALEWLATRTDAETLEKLVVLSADADDDLAASALSTLAERAPARSAEIAQRRLQRATSEQRTAILGAISGLPPALSRPLFEVGLNDPNDETALRSLELLTRSEGPAVAERLLNVIRDAGRSRELRSAAASALRTLGGPLARANRTLLDELSERTAPEGSLSCGGTS